ncbi:Nucleoside-diphosphate-sugar epimerase [Cupriavidus sp. YR651]|uniref:NAD-dependent epimerase/dehydratase family protein n=1 Tax=Cupriavidus sp. YR651 TaxID=1855315 RepID=UPI000882B1FC|nr:NAD(P)-dependent oxidoreductase [Cupriavidus sp. YR651]SDC63782.1 Nucleoside-diphosphate-sugar epimerase [Cupriavidus sp. YR651]
MRCTVIGGAGFVGRRLAEALRRAGHEVWVPARGDRALFTRELGHVYYCAGLTADYAARPFDTVTAHVTLLADVLRAGRYSHLVYLSSTRLYDSSNLPVGDEGAALTLQPANPRALYDLSKGLGENLCLTVAAGRAAVARLSCVFDWEPESPGFLSEWLIRAATERAFRLDSDGGFVRDYIHLDDVVHALTAISTRKAEGIFNVASGENVSNAALAEAFNRQGWDISLTRASPEQRAAICSTTALRALDVAPRGVLEVVSTYLEGIKTWN